MSNSDTLSRELGVPGAVATGLGSILGTGAFVAIGVASGMWGDTVLVAIPLAGAVASFNGLSSAYLAGTFPVAGGTYEYGYRTLNQWFGFTAGWLFLLAKSASAATAALGIALYLGVEGLVVPIAAVVVVTALVLTGIRRTAVVNAILVTITILAIVWFFVEGISEAGATNATTSVDLGDGVLAATAFLFVAYTGYGRIATLGEEVREPASTIPKAVVIALGVSAALYLLVEIGGRALGGPSWGRFIELTSVSGFVRFGAITAMVGVLLNLVLGLSRVWLAMGRRNDMPTKLGELSNGQPIWAIVLTGGVIALATLIGDIALAWSFSAMTVLLYYAITNLAALRLDRRRITAWLGMASCLFLSFFVPMEIWLAGLGIIAAGLVFKYARNRIKLT